MTLDAKRSVYTTNRGVNASLEIYGVSDQYLLLLIAGAIATFVIFVVMYIIHINVYLNLLMSVSALIGVYLYSASQSKKYGPNGLARLRSYHKSRQIIELTSSNYFLELAKTNPHAKSE